MFNTLRTKLVLFIISILIISSIAMMLLTGYEVKRTTRNSSGEAARNQLYLVKLNIENEYKSILYHKEYALLRYKEQLKNVVGLITSHIDEYYGLFKAGILSEEQAKHLAAESVRRFKFGNNDYFFIYDMKGLNISHPDPNLYRHDLSQFRDVKGKYAVRDFIETAKKEGKGFCSFWYIRLGEKTPVEKLSYVVHYKNWDWVIGTGVYIDDIEKDTNQKIASVLKDLDDTFKRITIGKTGYFYLFNKDKTMLLHPNLANKNIADMKGSVRGINHFDDLIAASDKPDVPLIYLWDKPPEHINDFRFLKESYVDYFAPLGWYIASSVYQDEMYAPARKIIRWQTIFCIVILAVSILFSLLLIEKITFRLKMLTSYSQQLSSSDFSAFNEIGVQIKGLAGRAKDEIGRLASAFGYMISSLVNYIERLKETTAAKEKVESELKIARTIQMSMVPHPPELIRSECELYAILEPARDIGGDFYDFFFIDDTHICLVIGDVADKGIPAALFMARSKTVIRLLSTTMNDNISPAVIIKRANEELCQENDECMFVTLFYAVININTGKMKFVNAGHNPPFIITKDGDAQPVDVYPCRPLGIRSEGVFHEQKKILSAGDIIFLYTDGVTEAMDASGNMFSAERLLSTLQAIRSTSPKKIAQQILNTIKDHATGATQSDDITILSFKFLAAARK
jgi:phosphoserine phosphatase RsbU/P